MNAAGIDVSKGYSTVTVMQPFGKVTVKPYKVLHTEPELKKLAEFLKSLNGETRVIMESTGVYHYPIANYLQEAGLFVSAVNAKDVYNFDRDALRKVKTDKADARKIAKYGIHKWEELRQYSPPDETRQVLRSYSRQYETYSNLKTTLKNNLWSLLEQSFPGISGVFTSQPKSDGHEKQVDFAEVFWHSECVSSLSAVKFSERYEKWCKKNGYKFSKSKSAQIYEISQKYIATMPKTEIARNLIVIAVSQINAVSESQAKILKTMIDTAKTMPEWSVVIEMSGVGENLATQLIAEIGDIMRYERKQSLSGFAGIDSPANQSGTMNQRGKPVTKSGSSHLRRILFLVMLSLIVNQHDDTVYHFIDKKRSEGKPYLVYMVAGMNKFLKVYYGKVKEHLSKLNAPKSDEALSCQ